MVDTQRQGGIYPLTDQPQCMQSGAQEMGYIAQPTSSTMKYAIILLWSAFHSLIQGVWKTHGITLHLLFDSARRGLSNERLS